ncbi:MAG: hypothetical protein HJJLKODD_01627 [Phycisphaerae bacterium]|nr:hypothetical protein [Phycisphaerae bacterium]
MTDQAITTTDDLDIFCPGCGYNLHGLADARCPECGAAFDAAALRAVQLPWPKRNNLGAFRAYWRTFWMVLRRRELFHQELHRAVSYRDAQTFRRATILYSLIPILLYGLGLAVYHTIDHYSTHNQLGVFFFGGAILVGSTLCLILFLYAVTGVPSYFFHPRSVPVERQNRAIALSYYTSAPLALLPWMLMLSILALIGYDELTISISPALEKLGMLLVGLLICLPFAVFIMWFTGLVRLLRVVRSSTEMGLVKFGVKLLGGWLGVTLLFLGLLPALLTYLAMLTVLMWL